MTIENKQYSKNDLEHVKFTSDSTSQNSLIQIKQYEYPVEPDRNLGYSHTFLTNETHGNEQNKDGSITPIIYEWTPSTNVLVVELRIVIVANNISNYFDYANIPTGLSTGTEIKTITSGVPLTYATIKQNIDFAQFGTQAGAGDFAQNGNNTQDGMFIDIRYPQPLKADANTTFQIIINDNLSVLDYHKTSLQYQII